MTNNWDVTLECANLDVFITQLAKISLDEANSPYDMASGSGIVIHLEVELIFFVYDMYLALILIYI